MPERIPPTLDHLTIPIDQPRPRKHNPRRGDIDAIAESLTRNGQYRPDVVVGLSKLPRLVQHYAKRPQIQERLTKQITDAIDKHLNTQGAACVIRSTHSCMSLRGVRAAGAEMVTSSLTGAIKTDPAARAEFMALTNGAHPTPR